MADDPFAGDFKVLARRDVKTRFLRVEEVDFQYRLTSGQLSGRQTHEIATPADSAAVLAYVTDLDSFVLIRQFRVATVVSVPTVKGRLTELPAGRINPTETAVECARREFEEETGYTLFDGDKDKALRRFEPIATILPSAGVLSERIFIFYVEIDQLPAQQARPTNELEDPQVICVPRQTVLEEVEHGDHADAKLIVAVQWFRMVQSQRRAGSGASRKRQLTEFEFAADRHAAGPDDAARKAQSQPRATKPDRLGDVRRITVVPGDIADVCYKVSEPIDIWVNSENTDMTMDRFFGLSVSATIRRLGAEKYRDGTIFRDTIADDLRRRLDGNLFVQAGRVLMTNPGHLQWAPYGVRKIFHAAAVEARLGQGLFSSPPVSSLCTTSVFEQAKALNEAQSGCLWKLPRFRRPYASLLLPLLGAGQGGGKTTEIVKVMVRAVIEFMLRHPNEPLRRVYLLGYTDREYALIVEELQTYVREGILVAAPMQASEDPSTRDQSSSGPASGAAPTGAKQEAAAGNAGAGRDGTVSAGEA